MTAQDKIAKARYTEIQAKARQLGRPTDELLTLYALEGFLQRLAQSPYASMFVLKGGVLLAAFQPRRPTRDIDMQGLAIDNDTATISGYASRVASENVADGLVFDLDESITAEVIRGEDEYSGVRVMLPCMLHTARVPFYLDVSVGDPIVPEPEMIDLPRLLGGVITLQGFPQPMVLAEKLVTAMQRGTANTRWRDFLDIYTLTGQPTHTYTEAEIRDALTAVAQHRAVDLTPIVTFIDTYPTIAQVKWSAWLRKQKLTDRTPEEFADTLAAIGAFCDPILLAVTDLQRNRRWSPDTRTWR